MIDFVFDGEGTFFIAAIDGGGRRVDQMFDGIAAARFENIEETDKIRFDVNLRMVDTVPHARLRRQIHDDVGAV